MPAAADEFVGRYGSAVLAGPFAGMVYDPGLLRQIDAPVAKLLGAYERDLLPHLVAALEPPPSRFIDIGAAEGYYAVGIARAFPSVPVVAFDASTVERRRCAAQAVANGVAGRVEIRGICTAADLRGLAVPGALVLSDCEGAEVEIFDAATVTSLSHATVIVELHGAESARIVPERFRSTHEVEIVRQSRTDPGEYPLLEGLPETLREPALAEYRPEPGVWGVFRPRVPTVGELQQ